MVEFLPHSEHVFFIPRRKDDLVEVRMLEWKNLDTLVFQQRPQLPSVSDKMAHLCSFCTPLIPLKVFALWICMSDFLNVSQPSQFRPHSAVSSAPTASTDASMMDAIGRSQTSQSSSDSSQKQSDDHRQSRIHQVKGAEVEPVMVKLLACQGEFMSNTSTEKTMHRCESQSTHDWYFYIQLFEDREWDKGPLMTLRMDRAGLIGELVWITRGRALCGTDMLHCFSKITQFFSLRKVYLMDTSQVILPGVRRVISLASQTPGTPASEKSVRDKPKPCYLRVIHAVASPAAQTWYEERGGFRVAEITSWPLPRSNSRSIRRSNRSSSRTAHLSPETLTQKPKEYAKALQSIRNTTLVSILKFCPELDIIVRYYQDCSFVDNYDVLWYPETIDVFGYRHRNTQTLRRKRGRPRKNPPKPRKATPVSQAQREKLKELATRCKSYRGPLLHHSVAAHQAQSESEGGSSSSSSQSSSSSDQITQPQGSIDVNSLIESLDSRIPSDEGTHHSDVDESRAESPSVDSMFVLRSCSIASSSASKTTNEGTSQIHKDRPSAHRYKYRRRYVDDHRYHYHYSSLIPGTHHGVRSEQKPFDSSEKPKTLHDLMIRAHWRAFHGTKFNRHLGKQHLRMLYDCLLDPLMQLRKRKTDTPAGKRYFDAFEDFIHTRVFVNDSYHCDSDAHLSSSSDLSLSSQSSHKSRSAALVRSPRRRSLSNGNKRGIHTVTDQESREAHEQFGEMYLRYSDERRRLRSRYLNSHKEEANRLISRVSISPSEPASPAKSRVTPMTDVNSTNHRRKRNLAESQSSNSNAVNPPPPQSDALRYVTDAHRQRVKELGELTHRLGLLSRAQDRWARMRIEQGGIQEEEEEEEGEDTADSEQEVDSDATVTFERRKSKRRKSN